LVKALAAGALLAAAALPLAIATAAGAADTVTSVTFSITGGVTNAGFIGTGASGTFTVNGAFASDGGNATVTTTAPGMTFSNVVDNTAGVLTGDFASTSATVPGTYAVTTTDDNGTGTLTGAFTVYGDPSISSALTPTSTASLADVTTPASTVITISGAGFVADGVADNPQVTFTSTVNGTTLTTTPGAETGGGGSETTPTSSISIPVTPTNSVTGGPATPGTYTVTVENADGGSTTSGAIFSIVGNEITTVSPSAVSLTAGTTSLQIIGGGFTSGATVAFTAACSGGDVTLGTPTVTSSTTISDSVTVAAGAVNARCGIIVTNTEGNTANFTAAGALGVGTDGSDLPPTITASSLSASAALIAGAPSTTITLTGEGFSSNSVPLVSSYGTANTNDALATIGSPCIANSSGTSLTCPIAIPNAEVAGAHTANIENNSGTPASEGSLAGAFIADGPAITSAAPAALATGAAIGTVVALTGTGFNATTTGHTTDQAGGALVGSFQYVSATTENYVVTTSPNIHDNGDTLTVTSTDAYGDTEVSAPFALGIDASPTVTSITYTTGTTGVGVGATAKTVTINGTGFQTGVKVAGFANASGTADSAVTATVVSVNNLGTTITATLAVTSPDANAIDGYTVTNPDGGTAKALAVAPAGLVIDAAPTITGVSPVSATPSSTNAFTITGTGFETGAAVTASSDGTCGAATVASATSITVSCTLGAASTTAVTLSVVNPDGGTATSGTVLAATQPAPSFHVGAVHGSAVSGKWVTLTVSGTGFYGQPHVTSNAAGSKIGVTADHGTSLTLHVWTKKGISGEHTFTITLANGKSGKANYSIKK
jgi:hypothetical protein